MNKTFLCYEDFGAKGDGITDDFLAIIACHEEANKTGAPVKTKDGATYYIGGSAASAIIKTDVDFGTSKFIIDDRILEDIHKDIFIIKSDFEKYNLDIKSLSKKQTNIDIPHIGGDNIYVKVANENKKIYIREGLNMNSGFPTTECFIVDKNGNIYPELTWDYPEITKAFARCTDDKPITIKGGIFTTIANQAESFYNYHGRGIGISRSHVTIENITYYVTGEGEHGAPYAGFIRPAETFDVTLKNSTVTPHLIYRTESKIPGKLVQMGTYAINVTSSIDFRCINVKQSIDIMDKRYWGSYTSNFSKNLYLENCTLSRYDAHEGVHNITIKGCKFGHQCMNLIGFGEAIIENTTILGHTFIVHRGDYGAFWNGNITVKNCKWQPGATKSHFISAYNEGKHDFGYPCMMAKNIYIDGVEIDDTMMEEGESTLLPNYDGNYSKDKPFKYGIPEKVTIKNITTKTGRHYGICRNLSLYEGTVIEID